jgi:16S rRNA (adenine1518-N6/adenine1519-N6)-dimethyltransferase
VVEIGAGLGALTVFLVQIAKWVIALEWDPELARFLQEDLFSETPGIQVICQDVLEFDFRQARLEAGRPLAVVGNLPYQITSPLLFRLIEQLPAISRAVLMIQQEVVARLTASPGTKDYGILSVLGHISNHPSFRSPQAILSGARWIRWCYNCPETLYPRPSTGLASEVG